ncbi:Rv1733c family protein [Streptomyces echinoruber]|uniref:Rv1733c family protein n=1 Tax=Streptomyces echinoruber TaxID=68898 RepID=UPI0027E55E3C|nr:hypothetical protein [Streptomyces echinoruber]
MARQPAPAPQRRVEAWLPLAAWLLAVAAGWFAGARAVGAVEDSLTARRAQAHAVTAVLTGDAPRTAPVSEAGRGDESVFAPVRWTGADGAARTGRTRVEPGTRAGARVTVWTDRGGRLVHRPATPAEALLEKTWIGGIAALGAAAPVLLCAGAARRRLERRRLAEWDTEWRQVEPGWRRRMTGQPADRLTG